MHQTVADRSAAHAVSSPQRRLYRDAGNWQALIADMTERLSQELDAGTQKSTNPPEKIAAQAGERVIPTGTARPPQAAP
jgi:hypothetical protein